MKKKMTPPIIKHMRNLREAGLSILEIAEKVHVSKSTVFRYVAKQTLSPEKKKLLLTKRGGSKKRMLRKEQAAIYEAQHYIGKLSKKEKLLFLAALYWAEGSKKDFGLSNTDPLLIKTFVDGLRSILKVTNNDLRISLRVYEDLNQEKCLQFWSEIVKIPKEHFVSITVLQGKKSGKLTYGMCRVRVRKAELLLKKMKATYMTVGKNMSL